ncbi:hypothetical protein BHM03_00061746, partial [Ensete ventricosum]
RRQRGGGVAYHGQHPCRAGHPRPGRGQGQPARAVATRSAVSTKGQAAGRHT